MAEKLCAIEDVSIDASTNGDNLIRAAVPGMRLRLLSYVLVAGGAVTLRWKSGATVKSGPMALGGNGSLTVPHSPTGHLTTAVGQPLVLNLGKAASVAGHAIVALVRGW